LRLNQYLRSEELSAYIKYITCFVFFLGNLANIHGQGAKFSVNSDIACNPFTVVVTDLSGAPDTVAVNYDYGDGSPLDTASNHIYSQPGTYRIIQTVANANPRQDTAFVEVIDQYPPEFFLFTCKGTSGSVFIRDTLYESYQILWGDGNTTIAGAYSLVTHNYGVVSSFDVTVKGLINGTQLPADNSNINCLATTKRLNMIVDLQPAILNSIEVTNLDNTNGSLLLNYTLFPDNNYLIEIRVEGQPGFVVADTINRSLNPTSYAISNLNTRDKYYTISITSFDPCDGDRRQSNIGSSIRLSVNAENRQNRILWEVPSSDFQQYRLVKDGSVVTVINVQNQKQYVDTQVACGGHYAYQSILQENSGFVSISGTIDITAISTDVPDAITDISASVVGSNVELTWLAPTTFLADSYIISRSLNGVNYQVIDTLTAEEYLDENLLTQSNSYYYNTSYFDACGNLSNKSITAQTILVTVSPEQIISWSPYDGWSNGVLEYILEKYDENGQLIQQIPLGAATSYQEIVDNPYQFVQYRVTAVPRDATLSQVYSNVIDVIYRSKVAFPNAFSPNGDGENDIFNFKSRYITAVIMKIYNRWGELVFQSTDIDQGWDGNINGKPAPLGTYIHHTQLTDDMGVTFIKSGEIVLIR